MRPPYPTVARVLARHLQNAFVHRELAEAMPTVIGDEHGARTAGGTPEEQILRRGSIGSLYSLDASSRGRA